MNFPIECVHYRSIPDTDNLSGDWEEENTTSAVCIVCTHFLAKTFVALFWVFCLVKQILCWHLSVGTCGIWISCLMAFSSKNLVQPSSCNLCRQVFFHTWICANILYTVLITFHHTITYIELLTLLSLINNRMVAVPQAPGAFKAGSKVWDYSFGV